MFLHYELYFEKALPSPSAAVSVAMIFVWKLVFLSFRKRICLKYWPDLNQTARLFIKHFRLNASAGHVLLPLLLLRAQAFDLLSDLI